MDHWVSVKFEPKDNNLHLRKIILKYLENGGLSVSTRINKVPRQIWQNWSNDHLVFILLSIK